LWNTRETFPRLCHLKTQNKPYLSIKDANGCTARDEPKMISKSHLGKSFSTQEKKRDGKFSPKKTMSGFTVPLHFSQVGTISENICSERKPTTILF
jgi:hypothetical protein